MGCFDDRDNQAVENGQVSLGDLSTTLGCILRRYPSCEELFVLVGAPSGDRDHISWSDLDYIGVNDEQVSGFNLYAANKGEADRCQSLAQTYCDLYSNDMQSVPRLSFAFERGRKSCVLPSSVL